MKFELKNLTNLQLILILLIIIILLPLLIKNLVLGSWFDYTDSGEIGDTLGGITSPFINGLAAVLVFITFKEQVNANKLIQQQLYFQHIQEQINRLEEDFLNISKVIAELDNSIYFQIQDSSKIIGYDPPYNINLSEEKLNKIMYSTTLFHQTIIMLENLKDEKVFFENKIKLLFRIIYKNNYSKLVIVLNKALAHNCPQKVYVGEIVGEMQKLNNRLAN